MNLGDGFGISGASVMVSGSYRILAAGLCCLPAAPAAAAAVASDDAAIAHQGGASSAEPTAAESNDAADSAAPPAHQSGWVFTNRPYVWLSGMKGDMGLVPPVAPVFVDLPFSKIISNFKFGLMGAAEARKGRFVASGDLMYVHLGASDNIEIREVDFLEGKISSKTLVATVTAGYRAVDRDRLFLDAFVGARLMSMKTKLSLTGPQRSVSLNETETWVDPVVGARFHAPLGKRWSLETYGDIGGFGVNSDLTWNVSAVVQYQISRKWTVGAGYRHLHTDFEHKGFVFDAAISGPILTAVTRF